MCSDGAREFMSGAMNEYCATSGIKRFTSAPYTPDHNEAENIVKMVTQGIGTLMRQFGGPKSAWVPAMHHYAMTQSLTPSKAQLGRWRTPYEAHLQIDVPWGKLTEGLHPFGCK